MSSISELCAEFRAADAVCELHRAKDITAPADETAYAYWRTRQDVAFFELLDCQPTNADELYELQIMCGEMLLNGRPLRMDHAELLLVLYAHMRRLSLSVSPPSPSPPSVPLD